MANPRTRSGRKRQREKATRAEQRGLPASAVEPRKPPDTGSLSRTGGRGARARSHAAGQEGGVPTWLKVALGAAVAIALVFVLSLLRKS